jgi:hypothetical protein
MSTKRYKIQYTEFPHGDASHLEIEDEIIFTTENIQETIDEWLKNRYITDYKITAL